jgi:hypothetical protein
MQGTLRFTSVEGLRSDLGHTKLYVSGKVTGHPALRSMIGGSSNIKHLRALGRRASLDGLNKA